MTERAGNGASGPGSPGGYGTTASYAIPKWPVLSGASFRWRPFTPRPSSVLDGREIHPVNLARGALETILELLRLKPGDQVLLPAYHCLSMLHPVLRANAVPAFYGIGPDTRIDPDELRRCIGARTRAVVAPHFFGFHQPMAALRSVCDEYGIILIEDCAHAYFGSLGDNRPVGSTGHFAIASPWKFLPVMEGGELIVNDYPAGNPDLPSTGIRGDAKELLNMVERSLQYGRLRALGGLFGPLFGLAARRRASPAGGASPAGDAAPVSAAPGRADPDSEIRPRRMTRTARLIIRHSNFRRAVERRRAHYRRLAEAWQDLQGAWPLHDVLPDGVVPQCFPLVVLHHQAVTRALKAVRVPVVRFAEHPWEGMDPDTCGNAAFLSCRTFQFPCHQELTADELEWLAETVKRIVNGTAPDPPTHIGPTWTNRRPFQ
ncbi:DegT/DnrJ/EryC1/StrS family aminotransferase [Thioalkalivibrio sp. AKL17]|uniref:DegT/DnrJ/EryC1/StrS family aminotransferase n=1 Tax=Thioalkalivibrio sp. AKL17 TaxID=1158160 RepID=UPI0003A6BC9F|nr:DegT/DnrJ/EryC1/StrS family aminotransferase [Thioalkalivibrio sp. AKL17]